MRSKVNPHVDRMARYLPFDPSHDQIYEEYQVSKDSLNLVTSAYLYVDTAIANGAKIIVLTGDAGHGKTNLCRRILQSSLGYEEDDARDLINEKCDGRQRILPAPGSEKEVTLRIFKDFSEFSPEIGVQLLEEAGKDDSVTIICANEGRFRVVLSSEFAGKVSSKLLSSFELAFTNGRASQDGEIHIVNLNYQSVASGEKNHSLVDRAIHEWTSGTRWKSCTDCLQVNVCPIYRNRELLFEKADETASIRKSKLRLLLSTLEWIGYVITIRDLLMALAYLITGGLKCKDIHIMATRKKPAWQQEYAFYNLAFHPPSGLSTEHIKRLSTVLQLRKLDPGRRAIRVIDELIINQQDVFSTGQIDLQFPQRNGKESTVVDAAGGIDEIIGDPRDKKARSAEAENVKRVVRSLRRRAYFDGIASNDFDMEHLGFPYGGHFLHLVKNDLDIPAKTILKKSVVAGLHHLQGLQFREQTPMLHLVDPAFGRSMSGTAILATRINPAKIDLIRLSDKWGDKENVSHHVSGSVDWNDRHIVLRISDQQNEHHDLPLDLMTFDCILRAAKGHVPTKFYEHDIRRINGFLGRIAQNTKSSSDQISLVKEGQTQTISIDGSTIQVGG